MNIKAQAFELYKQGFSYGNISRKLSIGKTTVYDYVKESKTGLQNNPMKPVPNSSEQAPNGRSERLKKVNTEQDKITKIDILKTLTMEEKTPTIAKSPIKEFTGDDLIKKKFDSLVFTGKFLELIGKPSKLFSAIIWGLPKGGKSNFSLRFADYLQEYFGEVVYIAAEEGESVTLQEKFIEIGGSKVIVAESRNREDIREYLQSKSFDFVFIDSINNAGIDNDYLEIIKQENPKKSFISIVQATKGGNFKGDQALTHNCDFIIKVIAGVAYHTGRFNTATEINIFKEPLYKKNPIEKKKQDAKIVNEKTTKENVKEDLQNIIASTEANTEINLTNGDDIDCGYIFTRRPEDMVNEDENGFPKNKPVLPVPVFSPKFNLPIIPLNNNAVTKNNLPSKPSKKADYNFEGLNGIDAKTGKTLLKLTGGVILVKFLYDLFNPKTDSNQKKEEKKK